ncbi:GDP-mannose mannosyl hydrolase [Pseudomonas yamanorum]|uniref:GDP-mannose mannosyl hydrolase n=1 Tax=Pseudomonas yamanorum TaxID=515393 RepID=UPI0015A1BC1B|nr:GDP-mannose mannosyl hydrolase [Pseudomonas yamanorum]NWD23837.1 GDP-mannose mannosyl hydrolase [Pseudomonas yamanorum]
MFLELSTFKTVVASTCLVSIDLIITRADGRVLLGRRVQRPAQGHWFVPGGRVFKGECLDTAFSRLALAEVGMHCRRCAARFLGVYEHFYDDSAFGSPPEAPTTHYVVLAYHMQISNADSVVPPTIQHEAYDWWSASAINGSPLVHNYTRAYLAALT